MANPANQFPSAGGVPGVSQAASRSLMKLLRRLSSQRDRGGAASANKELSQLWRQAMSGDETLSQAFRALVTLEDQRLVQGHDLVFMLAYGSAFVMGFLARVGRIVDFDSEAFIRPEALPLLAQEKLHEIDVAVVASGWRGIIGEYFDLNFIDCALKQLRQAPVEAINRWYTAFSDCFLKRVFELVERERRDCRHVYAVDEGLLAVYLTGTQARGQAFNNDYDLLAVLRDDGSPEERKECAAVVSAFTQEINRRGVIAQHRFAELTGSYLIGFETFSRLFAAGFPDDFIEKSQLLNSRLVIGGSEAHRRFFESTIEKSIFDRWETYVADIGAEINDRRHNCSEHSGSFNFKDCPGGLRDIELCFSGFKARLRMPECISGEFPRLLAQRRPALAAEFLLLGETSLFLQNIRNLYRLTVSRDEVIVEEHLAPVAALFGYHDPRGAQLLLERVREATSRSHASINKLLQALATES